MRHTPFFPKGASQSTSYPNGRWQSASQTRYATNWGEQPLFAAHTPRTLPAHSPYLRHLERGALRSAFSSQQKALFAATAPPTRGCPLSVAEPVHAGRYSSVCLLPRCKLQGGNRALHTHTHTPHSPPPCLSLLCSASQIPSEGLRAGGRGRQAPSFPGFFALEMLQTLRAAGGKPAGSLRGLKGL